MMVLEDDDCEPWGFSSPTSLVILGHKGSGKTSIVQRFVKNTFPTHTEPTTHISTESTTLHLNGLRIPLKLVDTTADEADHTDRANAMRDAGAVVVVYDITNRQSFLFAHRWVNDVQRVCADAIVVLVGNKVDCTEQCNVPTDEGMLRAQEVGALFFETSACTGFSVKLLFNKIAAALFWRKSLRKLSEELRSDPEKQAALDGLPLETMTGNALHAVTCLLEKALQLDSRNASEVAFNVWRILVIFIKSFPPRRFTPMQVEIIVMLACKCLEMMNGEVLKRIVTAIWEGEKSELKRWVGVNSLLRLATGVFPHTFKPLVQLLCALVVDDKSAEYVVWTLERGLQSITELAKGYSEHLIGIENDADAVQLLRSMRNSRIDYFNVLTMTTPSEVTSTFVQARTAIPASSYRAELPVTSLGVACVNSGLVTWAVQWNGWGALFHVLHVFLRIIQQHGTHTQYDEILMDDIITSVDIVLALVERTCSNASEKVRHHVAVNLKMMTIVTELLTEVAHPGEWAHGSWLTNSIREDLLTSTSSCLASMAIGNVPRAQYVLENLALSKSGDQPLHAALVSIGASCFQAIAAVTSIAGSHLLETYLPNGVDISSIVTKQPMSNAKGGGIRRHGVTSIMKLLVDSVLPVWNASDPNVNDPNGSTYETIEFPADILEFLIGATDVSLNSFSVPVAVSRVIVKSNSPVSAQEPKTSRFNILRALRASLALSLNALTKLHRSRLANDKGDPELTNLENALINSDTINALASIAAGFVPLLKESAITSAQEAGCLRSCALQFENRYSHNNFQSMSGSAFKSEVEDLAADCLSRLFYNLQAAAGAEDIVQVPWPATGASLFMMRHSGGEKIRDGIAKRLEEKGSTSCVDLLISVLSCGQRAAARSLLAPLPKKGNKEANDIPTPANMILTSVTGLIRKGLKMWANGADAGSNVNETDKYVLLVSKCVQFLIVSWESQNNSWFQVFWMEENMWTLLASILKCDGSRRQAKSFDIADAVTSTYSDFAADSLLSQKDGTLVELEERIQLACSRIDAACTWRRTVSDLLTLFASELLVCTGKASRKFQGKAGDEGPKTRAKKIGEEVFAQPQFQAFGEVFTEKWMHVLLQPKDWLMFPKSGGDDPITEKNSVLDGLSWKDSDTIEELTKKLSMDLSAIVGLTNMDSRASLITYFAKQSNQGNFGPDYKYDIKLVWMLLKRAGLASRESQDLILRLIFVNSLWSRADVQLFLTRSFAAMAYSVVFADVLAPVPGKALTYASPQFNGKLSRCLARYIVLIRSTSHFSAWALEVQGEMAKLLSFLAGRLTSDELEQPALTMQRFSTDLDGINHGLKMSPLGQLCFAIDRLLPLARDGPTAATNKSVVIEVLEALLVAGSYLKKGPAFRTGDDLFTLGQTCFSALHHLPGSWQVAQAAATALMSVDDESCTKLALRLMRFNAPESVFNSISAIEKPSSSEFSIAPATSSLLLMLAEYLSWLPDNSDVKASSARLILHHLSGGSASALFPRGSTAIRTYNPQTLTREPMHTAWCSCLTLASLSICRVPDPTDSADQHILDVLEFASSNLERISKESLNIQGDWPPVDFDRTDEAVPRIHTTIARVEEAEIATQILFQLSVFAIRLIDALPGLTRLAIMGLLKFVHHAHKLLRSEPLERWIKPVSEQEKARSEFARSGKDMPESIFVVGSPWVGSPPTPSIQGSPPLRSPRQAIMAAISGSGGKGQGSAISVSYTPPSPGMPMTPQTQSPAPGRNTAVPMSPGASPWTPHGSGLISDEGLYFGEECARSLLRALNFAVGALRRFGNVFNEPFVEATMQRSEALLDFGTVIGLLYHCVHEIQRGADGERRHLYMLIVENLLHISVTHLSIYEERGVLDTGFRNEVANKMNTVVNRLRKAVPPPMSYSLSLSTEIDVFIQSLQKHM